MSRPGLFITFEGIDGSGKTTQMRAAAKWMTRVGLPVVTTFEPGGTDAGAAIRKILMAGKQQDPRVTALLFFASRRANLSSMIYPALADGRSVLCDRFTDSGKVYEAPGLPLDWFDRLDELVTEGLRPDYTILLDLPPEVARERAHWRGVDHRDGAGVDVYHERRQAYLGLARAEPSRFRVVDARGSKEETERKVTEVLEVLFPEARA